MDQEEILNTLSELQYELAKVNKKLNDLVFQLMINKQIYPELDSLDSSLHILQGIKEEIHETVEIEKWVLTNSYN